MKRIGFILGKRIRGDLELGLDPSTQEPGIMTALGERLAGRPDQPIHEESEDQNFRIGTRRVVDDRVFRYCYAGSAIAIPQRGVANANNSLAGSAKAITAGQYTIDIPYRHADYVTGPTPVEYSTVDVYKDGWLWIMGVGDDPAKHEFHRIKSNAAVSDGYVRVTLYTPIKYTNAGTPWITAYPNIYANCQQSYPDVPSPKQTVVCMTSCGLVVTEKHYFWGQTWGPSWTTAMGDTPGDAIRQRDLYFWQGGVIALAKEVGLADYSHQRAGYILPNTEYEGDMMFMLQLAP